MVVITLHLLFYIWLALSCKCNVCKCTALEFQPLQIKIIFYITICVMSGHIMNLITNPMYDNVFMLMPITTQWQGTANVLMQNCEPQIFDRILGCPRSPEEFEQHRILLLPTLPIPQSESLPIPSHVPQESQLQNSLWLAKKNASERFFILSF